MSTNISTFKQFPILRTLDSLNEGERTIFDALVAEIQPQGVCVNVMVGNSQWDVRPLFLERGAVWIYRLSQKLSQVQASDLLRSHNAARTVLGSDYTFGKIGDGTQVWVRRPYFQTTLFEELQQKKFSSVDEAAKVLLTIARKLAELHGTGEVHGHLWCGNVALLGHDAHFLDPFIGTFPRPWREGLSDLAPEVQRGSSDQRSDIFGLSAIACQILGDLAPATVRARLQEIMTQAAARRPGLEQFTKLISELSDSKPTNLLAQASGSRGKVIAVAARANEGKHQKLENRGTNVPEVAEESYSTDTATLSVSSISKLVEWMRANMLLAGVMAVALFATTVKVVFPEQFSRFARHIPYFENQSDPTLEADWASGDRARMRYVAKQAVSARQLAAENAIIGSALAGVKSANFDANLLRIAFDERWESSLSDKDRTAALALSLRQLYPEGISGLSPIEALHPGIVLAVVGQMDFVEGANQLATLTTDKLAALPSPLGDFFGGLSKIGIANFSQPGSVAACRIAIGGATSSVLESYFARSSDVENVFPRLAALMPIVEGSRELGDLVLATLKENGGEVGRALTWFDSDDVAQWPKVSGATKLTLLLGQMPRHSLSLEQYSDLLTFPLPGVRTDTVRILTREFLTEKSIQMLSVIISDQARLTRKQIVAMISALHLRGEASSTFISVWFQTNPDALSVLRLLNARSMFDVPDTFNLEAARYLRKATWQGSFDDLKTLSAHPEPLARSLAYGKLSASIPAEAELLARRSEAESDQGLKEALQQRMRNRAVSPKSTSRESIPEVVPTKSKA